MADISFVEIRRQVNVVENTVRLEGPDDSHMFREKFGMRPFSGVT